MQIIFKFWCSIKLPQTVSINTFEFTVKILLPSSLYKGLSIIRSFRTTYPSLKGTVVWKVSQDVAGHKFMKECIVLKNMRSQRMCWRLLVMERILGIVPKFPLWMAQNAFIFNLWTTQFCLWHLCSGKFPVESSTPHYSD